MEMLREREGGRQSKRNREGERERERDPLHLCYKCCTWALGARLTACAINTLPQLGVHFSLQYDILKSEPSDEGHLARGGFFFFLPLCFFLYFLLGQKAGVIETRHKLECEAFTAARPHFFTEWEKTINRKSCLISSIIVSAFCHSGSCQ